MFHLKIFGFLILGVIALSLGAPVIQRKDSTEIDLVTRNNAMKQAVAIARKMKHRLKNFKSGEVIFYSGLKPGSKSAKGVHVKADAVEFGKPNGQKILSYHLVKNDIRIPSKSENEHWKRLWAFGSKLIAQRAKGPTTAIVGLRRKGNVYDTVEKPALMKNPNVPRLTEHNLVTGKVEVVKGK